MKWGVLLSFVIPLATNAATISSWNFNSSPSDGNTSTGTTEPALGKGNASLIGGTTATFATSTPNDPAPADNSGWNTTSYASQGTGNKSAGIQFNVSTRGYSNIVIRFEQRPSNTASRYYRFQHSTNGVEFMDGPVLELLEANVFTIQTIALGAVAGVDNNTNFAFRIVSEFEFTAIQSGVSNYLTSTTSGYSGGGSVRYDLVTLSGDSLNPNNNPPTISDLPDQTVFENTTSGAIPLLVGDIETVPEALVVTRATSNADLIPLENIVLTGESDVREIQFTPAPNRFGSAIITVTVTDEEGVSVSDSSAVTVTPLNYPPGITGLGHQSTLVDTPTAALPFTVSDSETEAGNLNVQASSSNPALVPSNAIHLGGENGSRTLTISPSAGQVGTTLITLSVQDGGGRSTNTSFVLMVIPTSSTLLKETFGYNNGSLITNSAGFWSTHGGITGQTQVASQELDVRFSQSEDIHAPLLGGPFAADGNATLYASFDIRFANLPTTSAEYLAHFGSGTFRARVFATPTDAAPGQFRLGIANGSASQTQLAIDLSSNNTYKVVLRYNVGSATSTLWINPTSEGDSMATATDTVTAIAINAFSIRQAAGIGNSMVDNLTVGTRFSDVVSAIAPRLQIRLTTQTAEVFWPNSALAAGYQLQSNSTPDPNGWFDVNDPPNLEQGSLVVRFPDASGNRFFRLIRP